MLNEKVTVMTKYLNTHFANLVNELDIDRNLHTINTAKEMNIPNKE